MKTKAKLKWFTLIEMLIVMVIVGILAVVLTESYITISKMALKIEQEKNISEESLVLTQIFQSISDEATIDYEKYGSNLSETNWFTKILYLTWEAWTWTSIYSTWECLNLDWNFQLDENWQPTDEIDIKNYSWCSLVLEKDGKPTPLLYKWKVIPSKAMFRIIPYDSDANYFTGSETNIINKLHQPWFRVFIHLYSPLYKPTWTNKIDEPLQLFFNLNV